MIKTMPKQTTLFYLLILFPLVLSCANRAPIPLTDTAILDGKSFKLEVKRPATLKVYLPNAITLDTINPNGTYTFSKEKPALWTGQNMMGYIADPSAHVGEQMKLALEKNYNMTYSSAGEEEGVNKADYLAKLYTFHWMLHHNKDKPEYNLEYFMWFKLFDTKSNDLVARVHCLQKTDNVDFEKTEAIQSAFMHAAALCADKIIAEAFIK